MNITVVSRTAITGLALALSGAAFSQVSIYDMFRSQYYSQTSAAAPTGANGWQFSARIFFSTPGDITDATLTDPSGKNYDMNTLGIGVIGYYDSSPTSEANMESMYPQGTYNYAANTGTLAGESGQLVLGAPDYSTTVPYFTGSSFSALQGAVAGQSVAVSWNSYTDALGTATSLLTYLSLYNVTTGQAVYGNSGDEASYLSDTIAGNLLVAGDTYSLGLDYSSRVDPGNGHNFGGAPNLVGSDLVTNLSFTVQAAPEPAEFIGLVVALGALGLAKRKA